MRPIRLPIICDQDVIRKKSTTVEIRTCYLGFEVHRLNHWATWAYVAILINQLKFIYTCACVVELLENSQIQGFWIGLTGHVFHMLSYDNLTRDWSSVTAYFSRPGYTCLSATAVQKGRFTDYYASQIRRKNWWKQAEIRRSVASGKTSGEKTSGNWRFPLVFR